MLPALVSTRQFPKHDLSFFRNFRTILPRSHAALLLFPPPHTLHPLTLVASALCHWWLLQVDRGTVKVLLLAFMLESNSPPDPPPQGAVVHCSPCPAHSWSDSKACSSPPLSCLLPRRSGRLLSLEATQNGLSPSFHPSLCCLSLRCKRKDKKLENWITILTGL